MKFTVSWLKKYLETEASVDELCIGLTSLGLEVEGVEDMAAQYAPFTLARVESAEQHPDADRLKVCRVQTKDGEKQIVCGAPNARAGINVIFAPEGSYIPGLDVTLKKSKIRGVESHGMMVSEKEMMLSDEHKGIIEIEGDQPIGTAMADIYGLNECVIEIGLTPNRSDCAGIYGIARDLAAAGYGTLKAHNPELDLGSAPESSVQVTIADDGNGCKAFYGCLIEGVENGPSPQWLQDQLKAIGLRPISTLVDITNYMCIGYGRPLHVYDADKLKGNIVARMAKAGEEFDALNDKSYTTQAGMTAIADDSGILGLGGIVGGVSTGCDENTKNVFLECAYFDPSNIARTGRDLQVITDARYRFERGVDPSFLETGTEIAVSMILELCGGKASQITRAGEAPLRNKAISFDPKRTKALGGVEINTETQYDILQKLGMQTNSKSSDPKWEMQIAEWRHDIEGEADLVEEVLRVYGYDNIEAVSVKSSDMSALPHQPAAVTLRQNAQRALAAHGMQEAVTWSFMKEALADHFVDPAHNVDTDAITLTNPISSDLSRLRSSVLPNLIEAAKRNHDRGHGDTALFEIGPIFYGNGPKDTQDVACGVRHGFYMQKNWNNEGDHRPVDLFDARADALRTIVACGGPAAPQITADAPSWYHPGRSGVLRLGKMVLAHFGEIHPAILDEIDIQGPAVGFEVFLNAIPQKKAKSAAKPLLKASNLQPLSRDFAFLFDENVEAGAIMRAVQSADKALINDVRIFDVYQGKGVAEGEKSIALSVRIQPQDATLKEQEIEALSTKIVEHVAKQTGGKLRA